MPNEISDHHALQMPAAFVNKFQVLVAGSNIRMALGEGVPGTPNFYRTAVVLSAPDALELVDALLQAIKTINPAPPAGLGLFGGVPLSPTGAGIGLINTLPRKP